MAENAEPPINQHRQLRAQRVNRRHHATPRNGHDARKYSDIEAVEGLFKEVGDARAVDGRIGDLWRKDVVVAA